jgi:hypothetical protein
MLIIIIIIIAAMETSEARVLIILINSTMTTSAREVITGYHLQINLTSHIPNDPEGSKAHHSTSLSLLTKLRK